MIILGSASIQGNTVQIDTKTVAGFGSVQAVRLTNYTADALILTNINGTGQSQEYLMPLQQMVYHTLNVSTIPTVIAQSLGTAFDVAALFVEWSTDPTIDFIGTYPQQVTQVPVILPPPAAATKVNTGTYIFPDTVTIYTIPANAKRVDITVTNQSTNGADIAVGGSGTPDFATSPVLSPGQSITFVSVGELNFIAGLAACVLGFFEETK